MFNNLCEDPAICYGNSKYRSKFVIIPPCLWVQCEQVRNSRCKSNEACKVSDQYLEFKPTLKLPTLKWGCDLFGGQARTHWYFYSLLSISNNSILCVWSWCLRKKRLKASMVLSLCPSKRWWWGVGGGTITDKLLTLEGVSGHLPMLEPTSFNCLLT